MNILITGTSRGIGRATALKFLKAGHKVIGLDIKEDTICSSIKNPENYQHIIANISKKESLPECKDFPILKNVEILINNAGIQSICSDKNPFCIEDINVNLIGTINITEKYAFQPSIKSVLFNSSVSSLTGNEFPSYVASKAGVTGYMKNCAIRLANKYKATCNALCFGGVITELNKPVIDNKILWQKIMDITPLKKWMTAAEAAEWCFFITVTNSFCTGQAIDISGGERNCADLFVWPEDI